MTQSAFLALADGTIVEGIALGASGESVGELVFNTAMTGYQEIVTDPSYRRQIVTLTYPHIGNTGCNTEDQESAAVHCAGLVIRDLPPRTSSWRSAQTLDAYLSAHGCCAIAEVDTRMLTRRLRDAGALGAAIVSGPEASAQKALALAAQFPGMAGMDLAAEVSTAESYTWRGGTWQPESGYAAGSGGRWRVVAYDFGVKRNILRMLVDRDCAVTVVPATTPADEVLALRPHGVFLSNGPGDPEPCDYAIAAIRRLLDAGVPLFGICLGFQLLGLAAGGMTRKMKFGHHGANHPVLDLATRQVYITSQNHGFAVDEGSLPDHLQATHRSLFDGSLQGLRHREKPAFGFQGHPEASPGPHDIGPLFDRFIDLMQAA
ncbi:MAG: glutamine-hydrolyzing carbamoyl-phosphate synthase small subunit [Pseudomonadota bacterium]|nr:glutamine-hydrolyzing carbamoyl-phosphate synthase small subunit [Pseudomonadota bacterium]